jgi:hypothetical protein
MDTDSKGNVLTTQLESPPVPLALRLFTQPQEPEVQSASGVHLDADRLVTVTQDGEPLATTA